MDIKYIGMFLAVVTLLLFYRVKKRYIGDNGEGVLLKPEHRDIHIRIRDQLIDELIKISVSFALLEEAEKKVTENVDNRIKARDQVTTAFTNATRLLSEYKEIRENERDSK